MSPGIKYTLARVGLFVVFALALTPLNLDFLLRLIIALAISSIVSYFLLSKWRNEMAEHIGKSMQARRAEKNRLRSALEGDEESSDKQK